MVDVFGYYFDLVDELFVMKIFIVVIGCLND